MSLLKEIGAILGFVAFGGLTVLAFLTFQQARHLRRLREWAGRQPERAAAEEERVAEVAAEAAAASGVAPEEDTGPGRLERMRGEIAFRFEEFDRRSPVDARLLLGGILAIVVAVVILTSGFGLIGGGDSSPTSASSEPSASAPKVEVAVLNGTAPAVGEVGIVGIAKRVAADVKQDGYKIGEIGDAGSYPDSLVFFKEGAKKDAKSLASDVSDLFGGEPQIELMTPEIQDVAKGADLALVIGVANGDL
jgi:LytR cell envelope-related transcriptional attenuator